MDSKSRRPDKTIVAEIVLLDTPAKKVEEQGNKGLKSGTYTLPPEEEGSGEIGQLILRYSDTGKGIPADIIDKVFDPFFTTNRQGGGSGLGLHIVYNLVTHKLNGTIACKSTVGQGTTFTIKLPMSI